MEVSIIKIGNSKGLRLSKTILEKYNLKDKVELKLEKDQILLKAVAKSRNGWDSQLKEMRGRQDDELLTNGVYYDQIFDKWN